MNVVAYDTETTGLHLYTGDRMFAFSTCSSSGKVDVASLIGSAVQQTRGRRQLERFWSPKARTPVTMHGAKFDLTATEEFLGHPILHDRKFHCTITLARLLRSNLRSYELRDILWVLIGYPRDDEKLVRRLAGSGKNKDYSKVPPDLMRVYQERDTEGAELLALMLLEKLSRAPRGIREVYDWELKLIPVTQKMEKRGVYVRRPAAEALIRKLERQIEEGLDKVSSIAGRKLNPKSSTQVPQYLYEELGLPVLKRTSTGKPSADKDTLLELAKKHDHPILHAILECRSYIGGRAAVRSYLELSEKDGRLHPDINPSAAETGRESVSMPNLQNVEVEGRIDNPYPVPARIAFGPGPGCFNLHVDYSGVEMRGIVHEAQDPVMIKAFHEGLDPHALAAEVWYGDDFLHSKGAKRKAMRDAAKAANFARPYGGGVAKLATILYLLSRAEVAAKMPQYSAKFPGVDSLPIRIRELVLAQGYVTTEFGRRIYVPRHKPYVGVSYIIQGMCADILKRAQVRVAEYLEQQWGDMAQIILPIHDELVIECHLRLLRHVPQIVREVSEIMVDFPELRVPLEVEWKIGKRDWAHLEPVHA